MTQSERRAYLIRFLQRECGQREQVPADADEQRQLLRALMNVRQPAEIAVQTVRDYRREHHSDIKVIFNVFKDLDERLYHGLLG